MITVLLVLSSQIRLLGKTNTNQHETVTGIETQITVDTQSNDEVLKVFWCRWLFKRRNILYSWDSNALYIREALVFWSVNDALRISPCWWMLSRDVTLGRPRSRCPGLSFQEFQNISPRSAQRPLSRIALQASSSKLSFVESTQFPTLSGRKEHLHSWAFTFTLGAGALT